QCRSPIVIVDDDVDAAVVVKITEGCAAGRQHERETRACRSRHLLKSPALEIAKEQRTLRPRHSPVKAGNLWINMTHRNKEVKPAIVVEVEKTRTPSKKRGRPAEPKRCCQIGKRGTPKVPTQRVEIVREIGDVGVDTTIVIVVAKRQSHAGLLTSVFVYGESGREADLLERPLARVSIEIVGR